jgi:predicted membrane-bound mannosyltransferase
MQMGGTRTARRRAGAPDGAGHTAETSVADRTPAPSSAEARRGAARQWWATVLLLVAVTAAVRLPGVARPLVGHFATKNVAYATIARNWARGQASFWCPTLDVLVEGQPGVHLLEVPLSAYLAGALWWMLGGNLDIWGRATSIGFSCGAVVLLFFLVRRWHGPAAAWGAALMLALSPASIIFGQSFMLEASVVCGTLAAVAVWDRWLLSGRLRHLGIAAVLLALVFLSKVYMVVMLLPLGAMMLSAYLADRRGESRGGNQAADPRATNNAMWVRRALAGTLALVLAVFPAASWCAMVFEATSPGGALADRVYYSLRASAETHAWPPELLAEGTFYAHLVDDLGGIVLTPLGLGLAVLGFTGSAWRRHAAYLAAAVLLIVALPAKFHHMPYYFVVILPPLCILAGLGWSVLYRQLQPRRGWIAGLLLAAVLMSASYAVEPAFVTPHDDALVVEAAAELRAVAGPNERIVTVHGTTFDLLYYCDRQGWAVSPFSPRLADVLDEARRQGARFVVVAGRSPPKELLEGFRTVRAVEGYAVLDMTQGPLLP